MMKSAEAPILEFQEDCFQALRGIPKDNKRLLFLKQLFALAMLYDDIPGNLNAIRMALIEHDFQSFPIGKYFGIPLYSTGNKGEVAILKYTLFPEETGLFDKDGKFICAWHPDQAMKHFITMINRFLETNIHELKASIPSQVQDRKKRKAGKSIASLANYFKKSNDVRTSVLNFCTAKNKTQIQIAAKTLSDVILKKHFKAPTATILSTLFIEIGILSSKDFKNYSDYLRRLKNPKIKRDEKLFTELSNIT